jgi:hypothetical protein
MRNIFNIISLFVVVCALVLSVSCTPGSCFEETNAFLKASFYQTSTGRAVPPDSLTLHGIGKDSVIYKKTPRVQPAMIPLNASAPGCRFLIRINGVDDTISFFYSTFAHLISKECGYTFFHDLDSVAFTRNMIDTIQVKLKTITIFNEPNIFIYY